MSTTQTVTTESTTTTLGKIREHGPCADGWRKLTSALGTTEPETEVTLAQIHASNGTADMAWAVEMIWPEMLKDKSEWTNAVAGLGISLEGLPFRTELGGDGSTLTGGYGSTLTGGDRSTLIIKRWDYEKDRCRFEVAYVGEDDIQADTPYRLNDDHKFVAVITETVAAETVAAETEEVAS